MKKFYFRDVKKTKQYKQRACLGNKPLGLFIYPWRSTHKDLVLHLHKPKELENVMAYE